MHPSGHMGELQGGLGGAVQQRGAEVSRRSSWDWCSVEELKKIKIKTWQNKHNRILSMLILSDPPHRST